MLYLNTVEPKTLELLKKLQKVPEFSDLRLVGGTGLSLQYGHRKSVDIDLFGNINIYYILKNHSFDKIMTFYEEKYNDGNVFLLLKSLVYFDDAEYEPMPLMFEDIDWQKIKNKIKDVVSNI